MNWDEFFRYDISLNLGIIPQQDAEILKKTLEAMSKDERRKAQRKFRKLWRKLDPSLKGPPDKFASVQRKRAVSVFIYQLALVKAGFISEDKLRMEARRRARRRRAKKI